MDIILTLSIVTLFLGLSFALVWMVTDTIKSIFTEYQKDSAERRIIDGKLIDALDNIAEALENGRQNQQMVQQPIKDDRVVNDDYTPQSPGHVETKQTVEVRIRADAAVSAEEAGIANLVLKSTKSPVTFGQEE